MLFPLTIVVLDLEDIFHFFYNSAGVNIHDKGVAALSLSFAVLRTLLVVLVFFIGLALIGLALMGGLPTGTSAEGKLVDLVFSESFSSFLAGLFPWEHLESILWVLEDDCSNVFTSALTAFSTASFQESKSRPRTSNWAQTESFKPSQKYRIMISSFGIVVGLNSWKTSCRCSKWTAQLRASSSWY